MKEYRIKVTVRNNLLLSAIEAAGYKTQAEFARAAELSVGAVNNLVAMRFPPIGELGEFCSTAKVIMEVLGACPSDLWSDEQLAMRLHRNTGETTMDGIAVQAMLENHVESMALPDPADAVEENELSAIVANVLGSLTKRENEVLRMRGGIGINNEFTREEVAKHFDVTCERIRQIEAKALRKLRHPSHTATLEKYLRG